MKLEEITDEEFTLKKKKALIFQNKLEGSKTDAFDQYFLYFFDLHSLKRKVYSFSGLIV